MNQFLAILKDSYREALNTWVIPVMLILATMVIVLVASVSFEPITLQTELDRKFGLFNFLFNLGPNNGKTEFSVENLKTSNADEPWVADYAFDIVFTSKNPQLVTQLRSDASIPLTRRRAELFIEQQVPFLNNVRATDVPNPTDEPVMTVLGGVGLPVRDSLQGLKYRVHITTSGTKMKDRMSWLHDPTVLFFWKLPISWSLRDGVYTLEKRLVNDAGAWVTLLIAVIVTAGFIPNMLRKGTLDMYLSKPISRPLLLAYKFFGGLIFVFLLTSFTVGGVWIVIGLRTNIWSVHFLALIPMLTYYFAVLYSVSNFAAVLTRSPLVAIATTMVAWGTFFGIGLAYDKVQQTKEARDKITKELKETVAKEREVSPDDVEIPKNTAIPDPVPYWLDLTTWILHAPCPRTYDLDNRMIQIIAEGVLTEYELKQQGRDKPLPSWGSIIGVSSGFMLVLLGLSAWRFSTRDG